MKNILTVLAVSVVISIAIVVFYSKKPGKRYFLRGLGSLVICIYCFVFYFFWGKTILNLIFVVGWFLCAIADFVWARKHISKGRKSAD